MFTEKFKLVTQYNLPINYLISYCQTKELFKELLAQAAFKLIRINAQA